MGNGQRLVKRIGRSFQKAASRKVNLTNLFPLTLPSREGRNLLRGGFFSYSTRVRFAKAFRV